jgi:hypothetical protein
VLVKVLVEGVKVNQPGNPPGTMLETVAV